jgi:hypothetical protein
MPPKKAAPSKAELAKKQKVVEDKTFGLKNKNKSKNVQKYVQSLHQAVEPKPDTSKTAAKVPENSQIESPPGSFLRFSLGLPRSSNVSLFLGCGCGRG